MSTSRVVVVASFDAGRRDLAVIGTYIQTTYLNIGSEMLPTVTSSRRLHMAWGVMPCHFSRLTGPF